MSNSCFTEAAQRLSGVIQGSVTLDERMSRHTSARVGGPAALFIQCDSISDLNTVIQELDSSGIPWSVVGKGSNLIVHDNGYRGAVIVLGKDFRSQSFLPEDGLVVAGAGVPLSRLVQDAFREGFSGLEFAVGIPGTLGGAVAMNAGTRDEWIGSHIHSVTYLHPEQGMVLARGEDIQWGYRCCSLPRHCVILEASIKIVPAMKPFMQGKMEAALTRRKKTQPLNLPNAGSIFRNPPDCSVGKLVEDLGLKGLTVGDAQISHTHGNFIVNLGNASAADYAALILIVKNKVRETYGIELQQEVRFLGFNQQQ